MQTDEKFPMGIGVIITRPEDDKILIIKENLSNESIGKVAGMYCLPSGHVYRGEDVTAAATREALEETGYHIELEAVVGFYQVKGAVGVAFLAKTTDSAPVIKNDPSEIASVEWMDPRSVLDLPTRSAVKEAITHYLNNRLFGLDMITIC